MKVGGEGAPKLPIPTEVGARTKAERRPAQKLPVGPAPPSDPSRRPRPRPQISEHPTLGPVLERFFGGTSGFASDQADAVRSALQGLDRTHLEALKRTLVKAHPRRREMKGHPALDRAPTSAQEVDNLMAILSGRVFERALLRRTMDEVLDRFFAFHRAGSLGHRNDPPETGAATYHALARALAKAPVAGWTLPPQVAEAIAQHLYGLNRMKPEGPAGPLMYLAAVQKMATVPGYAETSKEDPSESGYAEYASVARIARALGFEALLDAEPEHGRYPQRTRYFIEGMERAVFGAVKKGTVADRVLNLALAQDRVHPEDFRGLLYAEAPPPIEAQLQRVLSETGWERFIERRQSLLDAVAARHLDLEQVLALMESGSTPSVVIYRVLFNGVEAKDLPHYFPDLAVAGLVGAPLLEHRASITGDVSEIWAHPLHPDLSAWLKRDTTELLRRLSALDGRAAPARAELGRQYDLQGYTLEGGANRKAMDNLAAAKALLTRWGPALTPAGVWAGIREVNRTLTEGLRLGAVVQTDQVGTGGELRVAGQDIKAGEWGAGFLAGAEVSRAMDAFATWLAAADAAVRAGEMSAIELAARAYLGLVSIHPFRDGNGRTARLLLACLLERHGLIPPQAAPHLARFESAPPAQRICADDAVREVATEIARAIQVLETSAFGGSDFRTSLKVKAGSHEA